MANWLPDPIHDPLADAGGFLVDTGEFVTGIDAPGDDPGEGEFEGYVPRAWNYTTSGEVVDDASELAEDIAEDVGEAAGEAADQATNSLWETIKNDPVLLGLTALVAAYMLGQLFDVNVGGSSS